MSLLQKIEQEFKQALLHGEVVRLDVLRGLKAILHNKEIELRPKDQKITNEIENQIIRQEIKKRKEAIGFYKKGDRLELEKKEKKELDILEKYLPEQLSDGKIKEMVLKAIKSLGAMGPQDLGKVMGLTMKNLKGQVDGNKVRDIVQKQLNKP